MLLPKYLYFTTFLAIWHPLKHNFNGLVLPNPIHVILISFTPIWFSLANLNIPSTVFVVRSLCLKSQRGHPPRGNEPGCFDHYIHQPHVLDNYPDHIGISWLTFHSVYHPGIRAFCFRRMNWFSLSVWHAFLSYYTSCVMYLYRSY